MKPHRIVVLPAPGCRRSRKILNYLQQHGIPFTRIDLDSLEGQALAREHKMRASPGILVDGLSVNPFDLLQKPDCRIDEDTLEKIMLQ
jgi:arsenate reductase-like glutaredoxin family protein